MSVTLRRARPGDALALRRLLEEAGYAFPDARASDETIAQVVRHPEAAVFVAVEGPEVVGYVSVSHRPQMRLGGRSARLDELIVREASRGQGIGKRLLDAAREHARSLHCVGLEVEPARDRASFGFYQRQGFTEVDTALLRLPLP